MPKTSVACIMMQKDEGELLRFWIEYHRLLFGIHSLFIYDNASTDPLTLRIIDKYRAMGLSVNTKFADVDAHTKRGAIFGDAIRQLDHFNRFDFYFPIDCDEFLVFKDSPDSVTADPSTIYDELEKLLTVEQALGIDGAYYNILGQPDHFFDWPQRKTFFRRETFHSMDSGFHEGRALRRPGKHPTGFCYMHYHHKPYDLLVEHSKNKLRAFFDPDDPAQLNDPRNNNRLTRFILEGREAYLTKFATKSGKYLPAFRRRLEAVGLKAPF